MKRAQAVTQRVGTGEIGERARIHIGWAKILPSLHGEDDDNGDNDDNGEDDGDDNGESLEWKTSLAPSYSGSGCPSESSNP